MKIEIDTERASKQELAHLADMLRSLAGSSGSVVKPKDVFADSSPAGGMFNMFGDTSSQSASAPPSSAASEPSQHSSGGDLFSLFSSPEPKQESTSLPAYGRAEQEEKEPTKAEDLLDDDKIVPY